MNVTFDPAKRARTLQARGLDFADAAQVFAEPHTVDPDERREYGEARFISAGVLRGRTVIVVWTPRGGTRRVISMRYANGREVTRLRRALERPG